jgi:cell division protease FtsH
VFGDVSTGAQNDLQMATDLARHMVAQYGMSERLGLATFEQVAGPSYIPAPVQKTAYSEHTARLIDAEVARLLDEAHQRVQATLHEQRPLLDALARLLLDHETVERDALQALVRAYAPRSASGKPAGGMAGDMANEVASEGADEGANEAVAPPAAGVRAVPARTPSGSR